MDNLAYKQDLAFVYHKLLQHPLLVIQKDKLSQFETMYNGFSEKITSYSDFVKAATSLTAFFQDGHTNIEIPYCTEDLCLNIPCIWRGSKLYLTHDYAGIGSGAEIESVENAAVKDLVDAMSERIPHENRCLVKSRMIHYPYKNYHAFSEMNLTSLFGNKDSFEIGFRSNGEGITKMCTLEKYNGFLDFPDDDGFVSYEISGDTAVLRLNACICNETYIAALESLAEQCRENGIQTLILDLSNNMGGSSAVIDEFIKHVDVGSYRRYEMIDYSQGTPQHITRRDDIVKNPRSAKLFPADIYCRVSHNTFSSARTFAVTLKDNGIAKIIGQPTGGKPSSFGMPKKYTAPNTNIRFRVSRCLFLRPNAAEDDAVALFPDL